MIEIRVNGEARTVPEGSSLDELIAQVGLEPTLVAAELNRQLVPRAERAQVRLEAGDRVELVTLVGGG